MSNSTFSPIDTYRLLSDQDLDLRIIPCYQTEDGEGLKPATSWKDKREWGQDRYREWLSDHSWSEVDQFAWILPDDMVALDLDRKKGGDGVQALEDHVKKNSLDMTPLKSAPKTNTANGGVHLYFQVPEGEKIKKGTGALGENSGVDIQAGMSGALLFIPPSYKNGGEYRWEDGRDLITTPLMDAPNWLLDLARDSGEAPGDREPVDPVAVLSGVTQGERNETLFRYACRLQAKDYDQKEAVALVERAAEACSPPYPSDGEEGPAEMVDRVYDTYSEDSPPALLSQAKAAVESAERPTDLKPAFAEVFCDLGPIELEEIRTLCKDQVGVNVTTFDKMIKRVRGGRGENSPSVLEETDVGVVGETDAGSVVLYSSGTGRIKAVSSIDDLTYNDSVHLGGKDIEEKITPRPSEEDPRFPYGQFKREIVKEARKNPLGRLPKKGQGLHRVGGDRCLIISGAKAAVINPAGGGMESIDSPVWEDDRGGRHFIGFRPGSEWCSVLDLLSRVEEMQEAGRRSEALGDLADIVGQWDFKNGVVDELVVMGGILQTICQDWPAWRPHYGLIAEQSSGKTTLFQDVIKRLLGGLCHFHSSGTTEAGMRQSLHNSDTGAVDLAFVIRDEFEQMSGHTRQKILDWMRAANRGGTVTKGTAGQARSLSFRVAHSFWIGSTEFGGEATAADWSRMIRLYLNRPQTGSSLSLPTVEEMEELGTDLVAVAISVAEQARTRISRMVAECPSDAPRRMKENHAAPLAFLQAAKGGDREELPTLAEVLEAREHETRVRQDSQSVFNEILSSRIRVDVSGPLAEKRDVKKLSIGQVVERAREGDGAHLREELESVGLKMVSRGGGNENSAPTHLFIHPGRVSRHCLSGTIFAGKNIRDYLLDLTGGERSRQRIAGTQLRGVRVPLP